MISELSRSSLKEAIACALSQCRAKTLALFEGVDKTTLCHQAHPDFSPVGWHLGHIAFTESFWLLERCAGLQCLFPQYRQLFAADGLPKTERVKLPSLEEILYYLESVREKVLDYLEVADLEQQGRLWHFLLQHECQHNETISFVLALTRMEETDKRDKEDGGDKGVFLYQSAINKHTSPMTPVSVSLSSEMIHVPAGEFEIGSDSIVALDNERTSHIVHLEDYWIDRYPVTCAQYRVFMEAKGYENPDWWSPAGWKWLQTAQVTQPLYWSCDPAWDNHPVCGVSWYEAEAYSRFVGKRLPTEAEWEKAASWDPKALYRRPYPWGDVEPTFEYCNCDNVEGQTTPVNAYPTGQSAYGMYDALGNVWEWTASWFHAYPGFQSYPYIGYSQIYFDNQHCVLKGGSWATRPWALRSSFRNWYYPSVRQIFAGFRCAAN